MRFFVLFLLVFLALKSFASTDYLEYEADDVFSKIKPGNSDEIVKEIGLALSGVKKQQEDSAEILAKEILSKKRPLDQLGETFDKFFPNIYTNFITGGGDNSFAFFISEMAKIGVSVTFQVKPEIALSEWEKKSKQRTITKKIKSDFKCENLKDDDEIETCKKIVTKDLLTSLKVVDEKKGAFITIKLTLLPTFQHNFVIPIATGLNLVIGGEIGAGPSIEFTDFYEDSIDFFSRNPVHKLPMRLKQLTSMEEGESLYVGGKGYLLVNAGLNLGFSGGIPGGATGIVGINFVDSFLISGKFLVGFERGQDKLMKFSVKKEKNLTNNAILFVAAGVTYPYDSIVNVLQNKLFGLPASQAIINAGFLAQYVINQEHITNYEFNLDDLLKQDTYPFTYFAKNMSKGIPFAKRTESKITEYLTRVRAYFNFAWFEFFGDQMNHHINAVKTNEKGEVTKEDLYANEYTKKVFSTTTKNATAVVKTDVKGNETLQFSYEYKLDRYPYVTEMESFLKLMKSVAPKQYSAISKEYYKNIHLAFEDYYMGKNDELFSSRHLKKYSIRIRIDMSEDVFRSISIDEKKFGEILGYVTNSNEAQLFGVYERNDDFYHSPSNRYRRGTRALISIKNILNQDLKDKQKLAQAIVDEFSKNNLGVYEFSVMTMFAKDSGKSIAFEIKKSE